MFLALLHNMPCWQRRGKTGKKAGATDSLRAVG